MTDRRSLLRAGAATAALRLVPHAAAAETVETIRDRAGHAMPYAWRPARNPTGARTLVWLHGAAGGKSAPSAAAVNPDWNVLVPLDTANGGNGSWWLGRDGDWFTLRLLHALVTRVRTGIGSDQGLYFAGASMGGYGSLLHGMLMGAKAVYASDPQTKLRGTAFNDRFPATKAVVGGRDTPYADLGVLAGTKAPHDLPVLFVDFRRFDHEELSYFAEHFVAFLAACTGAGANVGAQVFPLPEHRANRSFAQVLALFDANRATVESW